MRSNIVVLIAVIGIAAVKADDICTASNYVNLNCAQLGITSCIDNGCRCSILQSESACMTSACPNRPLSTGFLSALSNYCGGSIAGPTVTGAGLITPAPTTSATPASTAGGSASTATAVRGQADTMLVPVGAVLGGLLGALVYL